MAALNYHHLRLFHAVAQDRTLTAAARRLNLSQSALSVQLRQLEARLGHELFAREGRRLLLTEAGRIALDHADRIFGAGEELLATLAREGVARRRVRVGAPATLSRNFQLRFLRPALGRDDVEMVLVSGDPTTLFEGLRTLSLDVVLGTAPPREGADAGIVAHRVGAQAVGLHGPPERLARPDLGALLASEPVILPTEGAIRNGFASLAARLDVTPRIAARVDDMAMVRLLAREGLGLAVAPAVVLADEIESGLLATAPFDLGLVETFYAMVVERQFPHPVVGELLAAARHGELDPSLATDHRGP
ncbi:Na(+)/H(+) antiporter regulatory protein [Jannaschia seosinensis]|uniref:Na(+)/H(+) antiporter regulatory protein n=1 Tax=Jannaschia seosinensis TaxID=313367 RepID=A0A0M7BD72_9RHOB|nr:LysR family transcriptional regulator [Jannaschia seosinensis]CUH40018.1 Na(+)/H(+) antiporter regulatory protein [Jannaschia seosinensis]